MGYGDIEQMKDELQENGEFFEKDLYCPICFHKQEIFEIAAAHQEGYENVINCENCNAEFEFDTHVDICYYIRQAERGEGE